MKYKKLSYITMTKYDIEIKWPNDILVNKKKIAGILIENVITHSTLNYSVIGIGINVNQLHFNEGINATSLKTIFNKEFEISTILKQLCKHLENYYLKLKNNKFDIITQSYLEHLYGINSWLNFEIKNELKTFLVKGINKNGLLILQDKIGNETDYDLKEIKWLM